MLGLPLSAQYKCISCGKCAKACKMDVDVTKSPDHTECIRCGMCFRTYHRFGSISLFPVINALLAKPLFHYSLLFLTSKNPAAVREE